MNSFSVLKRPIDKLVSFINGENTVIPLEVIRIGMGLVIFISYVSMFPYMSELFWRDGWVDFELFLLDSIDQGRYSIFQFVDEPWQLLTLYILMLCCSGAFLLGLGTKYVKWPLLILFISFHNRNVAMTYGIDEICASILYLLCIAPVGRVLSLDYLIKSRSPIFKKTPIKNNLRACVALRLIQLQMALLFFYTGIEKVRGELWWAGDAFWIAINNFEFNNVSTTLFAEHYWLIQAATHGVIVLEIAYIFLIWGKHRKIILSIAISLHLGIAMIMGLYLFATAMIIGHLAFFKNSWYLRIAVIIKQKVANLTSQYRQSNIRT